MKWDMPEFRTITSVERKGQELEVRFRDGSRVRLNPNQIVPARFGDIDWTKLTHTEHEIVLSSTKGMLHEVSWLSVRTLTDPEFNRFLVAKAEQESQEVGKRLKHLRQARGIKGKDLAGRVGIKPQALSRIESGRHKISFAMLSRILAGLGCSLKDLSTDGGRISTMQELLETLGKIGLTKRFVLTRLIPRPMLDAKSASAEDVVATAQRISRIYGWSTASILGGRALSFDTHSLGHVRFKKYARTDEIRAPAYTLYAHWLAIQVVAATPNIRVSAPSASPEEVRQRIQSRYGKLSFATLLSYAWDVGIAVIPLSDPGVFHGACWRIDDRIVIVLKQSTCFHARWLYDLAHELGHAARHLSVKNPTVIETSEISPFSEENEEEIEASEFAEALVFNSRAEELAELSVERAQGELRKLKKAVIEVARDQMFSVDNLANYLAYRLSMQGENWWGAAANLQVETPSPLSIARKELTKRIHPGQLNAEERDILFRALRGD